MTDPALSTEAWLAVAEALRAEQDPWAARFLLEDLLASDPGLVAAHAALGSLLLQEQDLEASLAHTERALLLDPHHQGAFLDMVQALSLLQRGPELARRLEAFQRLNRLEGPTLARVQSLAAQASPGQRPPPARRLLAVYDLSAQPYSIGDLLTHVMGSLVEAQRQGLEKVDYAFITDPERPPVDPVMRSLIQSDNRYFHLLSILPVVQLSPRLGDLKVFDTLGRLKAEIEEHPERHRIWPSMEDLDALKYKYYDVLKSLHDEHLRGSPLPRFTYSATLRQWAEAFFEAHCQGRVPVVVNLRNNPNFHHHRNSLLPAWQAFFQAAQDRYPIKFILVCASSEVDPTIRACGNVVFAKDQHSTLIQDLALLRYSAFHIGASSGPAMVSVFDSRPYYFFNSDALPHLAAYQGALLQTPEGDLRLSFSSPLQRFGLEPETAGGIFREVDRIWASRDWPAQYRKALSPGSEQAPPTSIWLS